jgi:membrane protein YqaA with SNARE-associated domain
MTLDTASQWGQYLAALGTPGLFAIALLDSAAIPVVGGPESLTMLLAWRYPAHLPLIVLAGALGATLGNFVFYRVGRAGGDMALSRLKSRTQEWVKRQVTRHAFWALLVCVALPPPFPTKPIVLAAGVVGTPPGLFFSAVFTGRLLRYSALGYLGYRYGDQAARFIGTHYPSILLALAGLVILGLLGRRVFSARRAG